MSFYLTAGMQDVKNYWTSIRFNGSRRPMYRMSEEQWTLSGWLAWLCKCWGWELRSNICEVGCLSACNWSTSTPTAIATAGPMLIESAPNLGRALSFLFSCSWWWWWWWWWWCIWFWPFFCRPFRWLFVPSKFSGCLSSGMLSSRPGFCTGICSCQSAIQHLWVWMPKKENYSFLIWSHFTRLAKIPVTTSC